MARAHFVTYGLDGEGRPIPGATVSVREPDTESLISETIYAEDDTAGNTTRTNPFTADADGKIEIWLEQPKIVDLFLEKTGYEPSTIRAVAHQLTASTLTLKEAGTPLAQRPGINFGAGFDLSDDTVEDETDIAIDLNELTAFTDHSARHENGGADEISIAGLDGVPAALTTHESTFDHGAAHVADGSGAHAASAISVADVAEMYDATDVEGALAEVELHVETVEADQGAHLALGTDAHDAAAISYAGGTGMAATNVEAAIDELATEKSNTSHTHQAFPAGSVFISVVPTNPATLLGYGTWVQFAEGRVLVGFASGDPDFGIVEQTGGAKTHNHDDHGSNDVTPNSGTFSRATTETHSTESHLMPYIAVYMWKRTA